MVPTIIAIGVTQFYLIAIAMKCPAIQCLPPISPGFNFYPAGERFMRNSS